MADNIVDEIKTDLQMYKKAFKEANIPWVLIDGLVLGYVRDKAIIPWDTDVDLAVCQELTPKQRDNLLYTIMPKYGFKIRKQSGDFIFGRGQCKINLWFYHKDGDYYISYPGSAPLVKFLEKSYNYDEIQYVEFEGDTYPMPSHLDEYIADRYGTDWSTKTYTHGEWYKEKRGIDMSRHPTAKEQQDAWVKSRCGGNGDLWPRIIYVEDKVQ